MYYTPTEQWIWLQIWEGAFGDEYPILHVDTEHATKDGFWFATRIHPDHPSPRKIVWQYRDYGLGCGNEEYFDWGFNPWLNVYWCNYDDEAIEPVEPGWKAENERCRTLSGSPWKLSRHDGSDACWNGALFWHEGMPMGAQFNTYQTLQAPWETEADVSPEAAAYWDSLPKLEYWVPEPDTCTGVRSDINRFGEFKGAYPGLDVDANSNVPTCDGSAHAPNCTAATASHPACGGPLLLTPRDPNITSPTNPPSPTATPTPTPSASPSAGPTQYTATKTALGTATVQGLARVTEVAKVRLVKRTVTVSVTKTVNGQKVTKTGTSDVVVTRKAQSSAESRLEDSFTAEGTGTCTATTQAQADDCAETRARAEGSRIAQEQNAALMEQRAAADARAKAYAAALGLAQQAAKNTKVTKKMVKKAKQRARSAALAQF